MPTVRELVSAIRQRPGIDAALIAGRDGLVIAADVAPHVDPDELAARIPPLVAAADDMNGGTSHAVLEHDNLFSVIQVLPSDAVLLVVAKADCDLAPLIADLRRYRDRIAELV